MTHSMTHDNPEAWVILAEWHDSNATIIGPFPTAGEAEAWGDVNMDRAAMWSVELMASPAAAEALATATARIFDAAGVTA